MLLPVAPRDLRAAGNDDNVEWFGVYSDPGFRSPRYPRKGEAFQVELRVFQGDITGATVRTWDGDERRYPMVWVRNQDGHDIWRGTVSGTSSDFVYYRFEIRDGTDLDHYNALGMWDEAPSHGDFLIDITEFGGSPLGSSLAEGGVIFRVWAPNASTASVAGDFNGWSASAHRLSYNAGIWQGYVPNAGVGDEYKFVLDGDLWRTDPYARVQTDSVGNSIVADPEAYTWGDAAWVTPFFEDMVLYELHVGSFSGEEDGSLHYPGRFRDVVDRHLDHLVELGVNMIELMPVNEFAADRSWGYNPSFLYAIESAYGHPDDLKYLIDQCHQSDIGVLVDVVYNHMGATDLAGNLLEYDGEEIYFYPPGSPFRETPWGPRLDYGRREVREYLRNNIRYWIQEFHVDGFRLDGTAFVNVNAEGWQLLKDIAEVTDTLSRKVIVTAEHLPNDPAVTRPLHEGGAGIDAQWNDAFHDNLRQAIRDAAFGDPNMSSVAAGINHFELGGGTSVVHYIESHDEAAVHGRVPVEADPSDPTSRWARGRSRVASALVLFSAGIPMLLQGQELLESRPFGDAPENRIRWGNRERHAGFFRFMKDAIHLRRSLPALRSSGQQNVFHVNDGAEVLALQRWTDSGGDVVVVVSLSNEDFDTYQLGFPQPGTWYEILNGESALYGGRNIGNGGQVSAVGPPLHGFGQSASVVLPRMGVLVFARERLVVEPEAGFLRGDCNGDGGLDLSDAVSSLGMLFLGDEPGDCLASCDANDDGEVDISDAVYSLSFLFLGAAQPPAPWPLCGPAADVLPCARECGS